MDNPKTPQVIAVKNPVSQTKLHSLSFQPSVLFIKKRKPPSLVNLCVGVIGKHFEDIIDELPDIAANFPATIKMALVAIARRRRLLNDDVIIALADSSWEILDLSDSEVSDFGLSQVVKTCKYLQAVDISRCSKLTSASVSELLEKCQSLEILRWGGCPRSEHIARRCLPMLKPTLEHVEGESWEELDTTEIAHGATSLRWLVWPKIEKEQLESLSDECPRIIVNPKPSPLGYRGLEVPREARPDVSLDDSIVKDINPQTWAVTRARPDVSLDDPIVKDINPQTWAVTRFVPGTSASSVSSTEELPVAEKFRLAFLERDNRLAPKRAKNARQHQRRAEKEWVTMNSRAKALALASLASKSLHIRN